MDVKQFLQMIAGPGGTLHFRTQSAAEKTIQEYWINPDDYTTESLQEQFAQKSQDEQRNMWFQVSTVKPGSKAAVLSNVIWADCDLYKYPGGEQQALKLLKTYLPQPTVVVNSGRGIHLYWHLKEPISAAGPMSPAQIISKMVQWYLGGDAAHSPSKILRIPGTFNYKPNEYEGGKECHVSQYNDVSYSPEDFPIDDILLRIGHKLLTHVMLGPEDINLDRSEFDFATVSKLLQQGFSADECKYLLKTYPFSGKVASEPANRDNYAKRTVKSAMFRVSLTGANAPKPKKDPILWVGKSLDDILKEEKPPFVINDFLPRAGLAMIAAPPKARKSWSVMQMAYSVGTGQSWLGFDIPEAQKVLYVQAELPNWIVAERIVQMYGVAQLENVTFFHIPGANLLEDDDLEGLLDAVKEYSADLVIIDPVANFWQGDENSSSSVSQLFDKVSKIQALGAAVVMVHHSRKTEQNERLSPQHQRGSNVFFARPDAVMTLSPILIPGEVPHTWADFSLRAAAPKDALKLFTDSSGQFTITAPSLNSDSTSSVRSFLMQQLRKRTNELNGVSDEPELIVYTG